MDKVIKRTTLFFAFLAVFFNCFSSTELKANNPASNLETARAYIYQNYPWLGENQNGITLTSERQSELGSHFLFSQYHRGIAVYQGNIKINLAGNGNILSVFDNLKPIFQLLPEPTFLVIGNLETLAYFRQEDSWQLVKIIKEPNSRGEMEEKVFNQNNLLIQTRMLDLFARNDTVVKTKVFNPDPLTSSQQTYGQNGLYKNNNGSDATELTAELKTAGITIGIENDTFYASSPYIIIKDLEAPAQTVFKSKTANFDFNRSQSQFREMNCLYHIEHFRQYLNSINLPFTGMAAVQVDPTAYNGQDQSRFSFSQSDPALYYGTGGVPDAEDADVIIHEYTHAINFFVAPNSLGGNERLALDEGTADFMACQYSRAVSDYNWRWVFNWDGHNEFWPGRTANSSNVYPKDRSNDAYVTSLIWSSMLNDISEDMGRDMITKLLINSIYSWAPGMTLQNAADLLMQSDSLLYSFEHFNGLKYRLEQRGFYVYTGVDEVLEKALDFNIVNSEGFAKGTGSMLITSKGSEKLQLQVLNLEGKLIKSITDFSREIELNPNDFGMGVYLLKITDSNGNSKVLKVLRLD